MRSIFSRLWLTISVFSYLVWLCLPYPLDKWDTAVCSVKKETSSSYNFFQVFFSSSYFLCFMFFLHLFFSAVLPVSFRRSFFRRKMKKEIRIIKFNLIAWLLTHCSIQVIAHHAGEYDVYCAVLCCAWDTLSTPFFKKESVWVNFNQSTENDQTEAMSYLNQTNVFVFFCSLESQSRSLCIEFHRTERVYENRFGRMRIFWFSVKTFHIADCNSIFTFRKQWL